MSDQSSGDDEQSLVVNQLIAEFMSRTDAGESLDAAQFIAEHPKHAVELNRHFANVDELEGLVQTDAPGAAETMVGTGDVGEISSEDATAHTVVRGTADSETSVTRDHQQQNTSSATSIEIPETFGRYTIQKVLGQGAMGAVYLAKDTQLDRDVALKIPKFGDGNGVDDEELLARFYREARASATLRSPNICPVYDVGEIEGQHYITMAYIEGRPLKDFTKSKKSHSEKQIVTTIRKLALGLAEAHSIGVIHRDLKPANIMVDLKGEPVVMDFGLARRSASDDVQVTQSGAILGTPAYMAPEQVAGDQAAIDHRVDIYALGIIMYELITGEMPFKGNLMAILQQIALNNPKKPSSIRKDIDPRLETICLKMMAGDQTKRYQSMQQVAADLQEVLRNPGKRQKKEEAKKTGPKPTSIPSANEESNPALISVAQPKSYAEQLREKKKPTKAATPSSKSKAKASAKSGSNGPPKNLLIAGGLGGLLLLLGIIFLVRVGKYDVQITLDDPSITLSVDGETLNIKDGQDVYKLSAGEHKLQLEKDGLKTHVEDFTVSKDGKTALTAKVVNGKLDALLNGKRSIPPEIFKADSNNKPASPPPSSGVATPVEPEGEISSPELQSLFDGQSLVGWRPVVGNTITSQWSVSEGAIQASGGGALIATVREFEDFELEFEWKVGTSSNGGVFYGWGGKSMNSGGNVVPVAPEYQVVDNLTTQDGRQPITAAASLYGMYGADRDVTNPVGEWNSARIVVQGTNIEHWLNGRKVFTCVRGSDDWNKRAGTSNEIRRQPEFNIPARGPILLQSNGGQVWYRKLRIREFRPNPAVPHLPPGESLLKENHALEFHGGEDQVVIDGLSFPERGAMTWEAWVSPKDYSDMALMSLPIADGQGLVRVSIWNRGPAAVRVNKGRNAVAKTSSRTFPESGAFYLAVTQSNDTWTFWVNGKRVGEGSDRYGWNNPVKQLFAANIGVDQGIPVDSNQLREPFRGTLDEVRISKVVRYSTDFTPAKRHEPDSDTIALYHFDEGIGDILKDSSGNGHDGKIVGAKWVKVASSDATGSVGTNALPPAVAPFDTAQAKLHQQAWADHLGVPVEQEVTLPGGETLTLVLIPPGEFLMGSTDEERAKFLEVAITNDDTWGIDRIPSEGPLHRVRITKPFYLGKHEVTQAQWESVTGKNPSKFQESPLHPVEQVSWDDIQPFLATLNKSSSTEKMTFTLPSEAQWEFACRAGTTTYWHSDNNEENLPQYGWYDINSDGKSHPVGQLRSNGFGLYDIYGNVWEWCADMFLSDYYTNAPLLDPTGPPADSIRVSRVRRGGGWTSGARHCRSASRLNYAPEFRHHNMGFRLAATIDMEKPKTAQTLRADPDRSAAEWAIANGGEVSVAGRTGRIDSVNQLPLGEFRLLYVKFVRRLAGDAANLVPLRGLKHLEDVGLDGSRATAEGIAGLAGVPKLQRVSCGGVELTDDQIAAFGQLKNLRKLFLSGARLTPQRLAALVKALPQLEALNLMSNSLLDDAALESLGELKNLKLVQLQGTKVTAAGIAALKKTIPNCEIEWDEAATIPAPAVAPFDEAQTKAHQEAWAKHLGEPVVTTNSVGMQLIVIPPGKFVMGSPASEPHRYPDEAQVEVTLTQPFRLGVHEVTQGQWAAIMGSEPWKGQGNVQEGEGVAATYVSWDDATEFCRRLTERERERAVGKLREGWAYRLPTEAEWEWACRAGTPTAYWFGNDESQLGEYAWYDSNAKNAGEAYAHQVGLKKPNPWGLYDIHGNVWEWCSDWRGDALPGGTDPTGPTEGSLRVFRGGCWYYSGWVCRSALRDKVVPSRRVNFLGFRLTLSREVDAQGEQVGDSTTEPDRDAPPPAVAPFDAAQAKGHQQAWADYLDTTVETTNSLGQKMALIPPGEFLMGASEGQLEALAKIVIERGGEEKQWFSKHARETRSPQHRVVLTKPFAMAVTEVSVSQFRQFIEATGYQTDAEKSGFGNSRLMILSDAVAENDKGKSWRNPGYVIKDDQPVSQISWNDAVAFCAWLSTKENAKYRLPTETEWEFACRAGTTTEFSFGDDDSQLSQYGWYATNATAGPQPVAKKLPNAFGLFDMHGNLEELCSDVFERASYAQRSNPAIDPTGPNSGNTRVVRGGSWRHSSFEPSSTFRYETGVSGRYYGFGFRVVRDVLPPVPAPAVAPFDEAQAKAHQKAWADYIGLPVETTNSIGMKFVVVPPGEFTMGEGDNTVPVTLTKPFRLGVHEVTQGQWKTLMGSEPWTGQKNVQEGENIAAAYISWRDAADFCGKLTERERTAGQIPSGWEYRLPTEAEWENACRAGTTTKFPFGDDPKQLPGFAWCEENADAVGESHAHVVGLKQPNAWGLCDMLGNLWEWCADCYEEKLPGGRDPLVSSTVPRRSLRGGCWDDPASGSAARLMRGDGQTTNHAGFRVVLSHVEQ